MRMARKARGINENGLFHVFQSAYVDSRLFESDADRKAFLSELHRLQDQMNFDLLSYCLAEDFGYQLVLRLYGTDLSKVMKSLNIGYAMYKKSEHPLFKDRYKSKAVEEDDLEALLNQIHCERVTNAEWSECCRKMANREDCEHCIRTMDEASHWIASQLGEMSLTLEGVKKDKTLRNEWVLKLRKHSTLSLKDIGNVFGISESSVCKVLKKESST